ncbi:conserved hypothetical protein [Tenacibaculum sp. 190524A05c]|uniref:hypothetical protein n=1 Tax=Tenacibaculum platacis TaxID=3137852 RepID=UPI0031FAD972
MDFSDYIFRCHMVGKIINVPKPLTLNQRNTLDDFSNREKGIGNKLTAKQVITLNELRYKEDQSKIYNLTDGAKRTLSELVYAEKYNRKIEINSPKITKGLEVEKEARDILSRVTGLFLTASEERKTNNWVSGKIDIKPNDVIPDIKSTWSWESFSNILNDKPNGLYLRQGDSYMDLWGKKDFLLCHVLVDTPFKLLEGEIRKYDFKYNILNVEGEVRDLNIDDVKKIVQNHLFSRRALEAFCEHSSIVHIEWFNDFVEIPEQDRVHMIPHSFDKDRILQRNESISLAREYMNKVNPINNFNPHLVA